MRYVLVLLTLLGATAIECRQAQADPNQTVVAADQVLQEVMAIKLKQIPAGLLAKARGVAIIPNVVKIGFVAGVRRGHGIVMVRDKDDEWSLPQFVTLTGGSVGWQAGVQGSDVVLVFMTQKSVDGLMSGKFTIGADAAAAAGPVGRNAAAATDGKFQAEILSYSRSRGLFAGLALDGSAIEVDQNSHLIYYGAPSGQVPRQIPASASKLRVDLANLSGGGDGPVIAAADATATAGAPAQISARQQALKDNALRLYAILDQNWQKFLALPREVFEGNQPPTLANLQRAQQQYAQVDQSPQYKSLAERPEFQATYEMLQELIEEMAAKGPAQLTLPPPPSR